MNLMRILMALVVYLATLFGFFLFAGGPLELAYRLLTGWNGFLLWGISGVIFFKGASTIRAMMHPGGSTTLNICLGSGQNGEVGFRFSPYLLARGNSTTKEWFRNTMSPKSLPFEGSASVPLGGFLF